MTDKTKIKPIKRHESLVKFSQDHHFALLLVWKIKQGFKFNVDVSRIINYVINFVDDNLLIHFDEEENYLFSKLAFNDEYRVRAEYEHFIFKEMINKIKNDNFDNNYIIEMADFLEKHIRFEERILFSYLQEKFTENDFFDLNNAKLKKHDDFDENWQDKFWLKK